MQVRAVEVAQDQLVDDLVAQAVEAVVQQGMIPPPRDLEIIIAMFSHLL